MHYFLYVELPGFYIREWERIDPERTKAPLVVHRDKRVIDLNEPALAAGLKLGMGLDEAKVLLQGSGLIMFEEQPYRTGQRQWLDTLCEFSSVVEPHEMNSAWADLTGHPSPIDIACTLRKRFGYRTILGLASTKWLARLSAEILADTVPELWSEAITELLQNPRAFLETLPTALLLPIDLSSRERLKFLGYRTIGEVSRLLLKTLRGQFGDEALKIHVAAKGGFYEPVLPLYPPNAIQLKLSFPGGISNAEDLKLGIEKLSRRVAKSLSDRESHGFTLELRILFEECAKERKRTFSNPICTTRNAISTMTRLLGEIQEPVYALEVRMPDLKKARESQGGLFTARVPGDDLAIERAVGRMRRVFGDHSVIKASERIEPRRIKVLRAWSHATGWK